MTPLAISCQKACTPRRSSPLFSTPMRSAPVSAPHAVPIPPNSDVPPMTAAAIAFSSYSMPASGPPLRSWPDEQDRGEPRARARDRVHRRA